MSIETNGLSPEGGESRVNKLYFAVWRWHFYSGLYVVPFLLMLAITGILIIWFTAVSPEYGDYMHVTPTDKVLTVTEQANAALATHPEGKVGKFITPWDAETPALVRIDLQDGNRMIAVNPYSGEILNDRPEGGTWNEFATAIHGELLLGDNGSWGDLLIEIAASLGLLLIATGLYLAWPRNGATWRSVIAPDFTAKGRSFWKSLHLSFGTWSSLYLVFFLLSGLAWAGIWGGKFVQPWSAFPAEKWEAPLSDKTHATLNTTAREEVPWVLELTPLPQSGSQVGVELLPAGTPVVLETVVAGARALGFDGRVQVAAPSDETGVWTLSRDSMSYDSTNPMADRTVHIDQYTGKVLADVRYDDYPIVGKLMAVGIALHEGQLGLWSVVLYIVFCLLLIAISVTGIVAWWKRRPAGAGRLAAPPRPDLVPLTKGVALIALALSLAFPVLGLTLLGVLVFDLIVLSLVPPLKRVLS